MVPVCFREKDNGNLCQNHKDNEGLLTTCYLSPVLKPLFCSTLSFLDMFTMSDTAVAAASLKILICHMFVCVCASCSVLCVCVYMCVHECVGQGLHARFSLAGSGSPAVPNELCSAVLSHPLSREITLWSSSSPSPASLLTCAHSLINTSGSLKKSGWLTDSTSMSFFPLFFLARVKFKSSVSGFTQRKKTTQP